MVNDSRRFCLTFSRFVCSAHNTSHRHTEKKQETGREYGQLSAFAPFPSLPSVDRQLLFAPHPMSSIKGWQYVTLLGSCVGSMLLGASVVHNTVQPDLVSVDHSTLNFLCSTRQVFHARFTEPISFLLFPRWNLVFFGGSNG